MPTNRHWVVMADDTGDPGASGSSHFGYAGIAVERQQMAILVKTTAEFRVNSAMFTEAKARVTHPYFADLIARIADACINSGLIAGACLIVKEKYEGPYLHAGEGKPADPHFLRNFVIRHMLETIFQHESFSDADTIELVLDRVDYSDEQILNLRRYLNSELATEGDFAYPKPRWVTHASSSYVDGLQLAHHLGELALSLARDRQTDQALERAQAFFRMKTLVRSRPFAVDPSSEGSLGRRTRNQKEWGPETISQVTRPQ